jgi:hypothetical protein
MTRNYRVSTEKGNALYWYDRSLHLWVVTVRDAADDQIGSAAYAPTKKLAQKEAEQMIVDGLE